MQLLMYHHQTVTNLDSCMQNDCTISIPKLQLSSKIILLKADEYELLRQLLTVLLNTIPQLALCTLRTKSFWTNCLRK